MADAGYDVADYRAIEPMFGTLDEAEKLIAEAHDLGLRVILDIVPNHGSDQHAVVPPRWPRRPARPSGTGYLFRPGRGADGELPPNNWTSVFGGPAWTRVAVPDGRPASGTCTCSPRSSPTSTGPTPTCGPTSRTCCGSGSTAAWTGSGSTPPCCWPRTRPWPTTSRTARPLARRRRREPAAHPFVDRDEVHEVYRAWRRIADSYPGDRVLIGEVWLPDVERTTRYLRPGELQTVFNFDFLRCPWDGAELRSVIDATLASHARSAPRPPGSSATTT